MILVIGGYGQGKGSFAKNKFHMEDMDFTDGEDCDLQEILERKGIRRLHLLIRRMMEEQRDPYAYFMENRKLLKDKIILTDEIGLGIVPMEKENRLWREMTGRICCELAGEADEVYRVYAGIAVKIKEKA